MVYEWTHGISVRGVTAQNAGEELERIRAAHAGRLTADAIVETATDPDNVLHPVFEWDDKVAAEKYRLVKAESLVRHVVVMVDDRPDMRPQRAFVSVRRADDDTDTYASLAEAMSTPDLRAQVIERAKREAKSWRDRFRDYKELAVVFDAIDELVGV